MFVRGFLDSYIYHVQVTTYVRALLGSVTEHHELKAGLGNSPHLWNLRQMPSGSIPSPLRSSPDFPAVSFVFWPPLLSPFSISVTLFPLSFSCNTFVLSARADPTHPSDRISSQRISSLWNSLRSYKHNFPFYSELISEHSYLWFDLRWLLPFVWLWFTVNGCHFSCERATSPLLQSGANISIYITGLFRRLNDNTCKMSRRVLAHRKTRVTVMLVPRTLCGIGVRATFSVCRKETGRAQSACGRARMYEVYSASLSWAL